MSTLHAVEPESIDGRDLTAGAPVDAERAAALFLRALGVDTDSADVAASPRRMAQAYADLMSAPPFEPTMFANDAGYAGLVLARSIPVQSLCEHHFLPFAGTAHIGYVPDGRILGLSKLARLAEFYARRPQVQERLTQQIADWLVDNLAAKAVGVVIDAEHTCMTMRGVGAIGSTTRTSVFVGDLVAADFLAQIAN